LFCMFARISLDFMSPWVRSVQLSSISILYLNVRVSLNLPLSR
jgi:hypothetical protein